MSSGPQRQRQRLVTAQVFDHSDQLDAWSLATSHCFSFLGSGNHGYNMLYLRRFSLSSDLTGCFFGTEDLFGRCLVDAGLVSPAAEAKSFQHPKSCAARYINVDADHRLRNLRRCSVSVSLLGMPPVLLECPSCCQRTYHESCAIPYARPTLDTIVELFKADCIRH